MDDFADFMNDTILIEPQLGRDSYGAPFFDVPVAYLCKIDGATKARVTVEGVERTVNAMIYLPDNPPIGPMDRITMPAGFVPQQPPILRVNPFTDENGPHHTEIAV